MTSCLWLRALLLSRKNPFGDIKSDGTVSTALENLGFGEGANWVMLPGGMIIQRVYLGFPVGTNARHITFPGRLQQRTIPSQLTGMISVL